MNLKKFLLLALVCLSTSSYGFSSSRITADALKLRPGALPSSGTDGELRVDSGDSNKLKKFDTGSWVEVGSAAAAANPDVETISSTDTLDADNDIVLVSTSGGAVTINLPTAVGITGKIYRLKLIDASNHATIDPNSSQTIDGSTTLLLIRLDETLEIISDNVNWRILNDGMLADRRTVTARITNSGTPTVSSDDDIDWISSITDNSTGNFTIVINTGIFSDVPTCIPVGASQRCAHIFGTPTATSQQIVTQTCASAAAVDADVNIVCWGPR